VESVPLSAHCDRFIKAILAKGGYEVDIPQLGDLAIFNWDGDGESDHIGIVCRVPESGRITTIEGNIKMLLDIVALPIPRSDSSVPRGATA
jgi:hypothetical protein